MSCIYIMALPQCWQNLKLWLTSKSTLEAASVEMSLREADPEVSGIRKKLKATVLKTEAPQQLSGHVAAAEPTYLLYVSSDLKCTHSFS